MTIDQAIDSIRRAGMGEQADVVSAYVHQARGNARDIQAMFAETEALVVDLSGKLLILSRMLAGK
jgi:hypothetical protein